MIEKINDLLKRVEEFKPQAAAEIEEFRVRLLGRKGQLNDILDEFKTVAPEMKRELGQKINTLKTRAIEKINALKTELENSDESGFRKAGDHKFAAGTGEGAAAKNSSLPAYWIVYGHRNYFRSFHLLRQSLSGVELSRSGNRRCWSRFSRI